MPSNLSFPSVAWVNAFAEFTEFGIWWVINRCENDLDDVMDKFIEKVFFFLLCSHHYILLWLSVIWYKNLGVDRNKVHSKVEWQIISQENGAFARTYLQYVVPKFTNCISASSRNPATSFGWGIFCFVILSKIHMHCVAQIFF